jgi:tetratricopeptide (TPR) repeat protein/transcriptional regulator with XRE-family HTH domain
VAGSGESFGDVLRRYRVDAGLTQEALAGIAKLSVEAVSALERGARRHPHRQTVMLLADALALTEGQRAHLVSAAPRRGGSPAAAAPAATVPRQLPLDVANFVGRQGEVATLVDQLAAGGAGPGPTVFTFTGMAGVGKTALAVHVAHRLEPDFVDGQIFLDLRGFTPDATAVSPGDALDRLLRALGVPGRNIPHDLDDRAALWRTRLARRRLLMLLDNAAGEEQIRPLLPGTGSCVVLVTSRRRLTGLHEAVPVPLDVLSTADAVALFARISGDDGSTGWPATIVELCGHLPLAVSIAAARLRARPGWSAAHLAERLGSLNGRLAELDAGQRGMTAALDLSYRQLVDAQQRMFRLLGLHHGPDVDVYAAAALAGVDPSEADRVLEALVDAHLLLEPTQGRYVRHDLVRAYAAQIAGADPEPARRAVVTRMLDHYRYGAWLAAELLYPTEKKRRPSIPAISVAAPPVTDQTSAAVWLDSERANLLAMAADAAEHDLPVYAVHLAQLLNRYLEVRSHYTDALTLHQLALDMAVRAGDHRAESRALNDLGMIHYNRGSFDLAGQNLERARLINEGLGGPPEGPSPESVLGLVAMRLGRFDEARRLFQHALAYYRDVGDLAGEASMLLNLGIVDGMTGRWTESEDYFLQALRFSRATGNRAAEAHALTNLGMLFGETDRCEEALDYLQRALPLHRANKDHTGEVNALGNLGLIYDRLGRHESALAQHEVALERYRMSGDRPGEVESLNDIGATLRTLGRLPEAHARHQEALTLAHDADVRYEQARALDGLGHVHHLRGESGRARTQWRAALDIFTALGTPEVAKVRSQLASVPE